MSQTGKGVRVGIIDTGIDYTHADFGGPGTVDAFEAAGASNTFTPTAKVVGGYDFAGDDYNADPASDTYDPNPQPDPNPLDCNGHGSHVAGTTAGLGVASDGSTWSGGYRLGHRPGQPRHRPRRRPRGEPLRPQGLRLRRLHQRRRRGPRLGSRPQR